jgi:hypothetical protein
VNLGPLQFLKPRRAETDGDRVLVVQSGSPAVAVKLVEALRARGPRSEIALLVRRGAEAALPPLPGVELIPNEGPRPAFVRRLQAARYDRAYVLVTGEPEPWKLKVLPLAIGAGAVYAVNENLDWFELSPRGLNALAHHLRWRFESSLTHAGPRGSRLASRIASAAAYPAVLAYLLAFERLRSAGARRRGAREWKAERGAAVEAAARMNAA